MNSLEKMVLISNSVPKSGSSLLFHLQKAFIESISNNEINYDFFSKMNLSVKGGYIEHVDLQRFARISENESVAGPLILKAHSPIDGDLENYFLSNDDVHMSMVIRDPLDIFFSARRTFLKLGQFSKFEDVESGVAVVNSFYRNIFETCERVSRKKEIPIVRFEELMQNKRKALLKSFSEKIRDALLLQSICFNLEEDKAMDRARNRLSPEREEGRLGFPPDSKEIATALHEVRDLFGYA